MTEVNTLSRTPKKSVGLVGAHHLDPEPAHRVRHHVERERPAPAELEPAVEQPAPAPATPTFQIAS